MGYLNFFGRVPGDFHMMVSTAFCAIIVILCFGTDGGQAILHTSRQFGSALDWWHVMMWNRAVRSCWA